MKHLVMVGCVMLGAGCQCGAALVGTGGGGRGAGAAAGSGSAGGGGGEPTPVQLVVTPADAAYATDGTTAATAAYTVVATYASGETEDVSERAAFGLSDPGLGLFSGRTWHSTLERGGRATVTATFAGARAETSLSLKLQKTVREPLSTDLPSDVETKFSQPPDGSRAPELVYPNDGTLLPPNLGKLEFHFLPGQGNTLFELALSSRYTEVKVYLRCSTPLNGGCMYLPDAAVWRAVAVANRGGEPVAVTLKGTDDNATGVGEAAALHLSFAQDDISGGLYYWSTTEKAVMRFDFASPTQTMAKKFIDAAVTDNPQGCVGCHALSPDGKKMVVAAEGSTDGRIALLDVATRALLTPFPLAQKSTFESWSPDSAQFVGVDDRGSDFNLLLFDGATGQYVESIAATGTAARPADHPDWSADGATIAYANVTRGASLQWPTRGSIELVKKTSVGWSAPVTVAPFVAGKNRYYPAIAPSSEYLVFDQSSCQSGEIGSDCDGDTDPTATLYVAKLEANATLVPLTNANAPGKRDHGNTVLTNSYPKWSPFNFQRTGEIGSRLQWLTFSSTRAYGLRQPQGVTWLWMVAIDPDRVLAGKDPSWPAFCLPFQDLATSNHIAQWATKVVGDIN